MAGSDTDMLGLGVAVVEMSRNEGLCSKRIGSLGRARKRTYRNRSAWTGAAVLERIGIASNGSDLSRMVRQPTLGPEASRVEWQ